MSLAHYVQHLVTRTLERYTVPFSPPSARIMPHPAATLRPSQPIPADRLHAPQASTTERLSIPVPDRYGGSLPGILHLPSSSASSPSPAREQDTHDLRAKGAVLLLSGAGGGVSGPSGMYPSLGLKLSSLLSIPTLRLDYRHPARNAPCTQDVLSAMEYLSERLGVRKFVLVGWSFGGAPAFTVGALAKSQIAGIATIASQTAQTEGIEKLSPVPVLLLHGTGDRTLSPRCSESLYERYGSKGDRTLRLFEGDDHALTGHAREAEEELFGFVARCLGVQVDEAAGKEAGKELVGGREERVGVMREGGDLTGETVQ